MHYVYILSCSDDTLYTGYTNDLDLRVSIHNKGKGAKYTRGRLPVHLVYSEAFEEKGDALKREYALKQIGRAEKMKLIENWRAKEVE